MQTNKLTASALLICTCVIWGIQPMFAKFVVREMQPIPMVSIRYTIVALTLFAMLAWRGEKLLPPRRTWPALFTMGILGVCINNVTQFTGLQYSTVTNFTIIATLTPIVTALLSFVLIHERLHRLQWLGICSSLCDALYLLSNGSLAVILNLAFNIGDVLFFVSQVAGPCILLSSCALSTLSPPLPSLPGRACSARSQRRPEPLIWGTLSCRPRFRRWRSSPICSSFLLAGCSP